MDDGATRALVDRARRGDGEAFGQLFRSFEEDVARLCTRLLGSSDEAQDAAHETFLRARTAFDRYEADRPFRPWLLAIASHHAIDRLRRRSTERRLFTPDEGDLETLAAPGPSPLQRELDEALRREMLAAVRALPDRYRAPLVLRYYADLDYEAIALTLGVSRNQVGTLLLRGRRRLREQLEGLRGGERTVSCRSEAELLLYVDAELASDDRHALEAHLVTCRECRTTIVALRDESTLLGDVLQERRRSARAPVAAPTPDAGVALSLPLAIAAVTAVFAGIGFLIEAGMPTGLDPLHPTRIKGAYEMAFDLVFLIRDRAPGLLELALSLGVLIGISALLSFGAGLLYRRVYGATAALLLAWIAFAPQPVDAVAVFIHEDVRVSAGEVIEETVFATGDNVHVDGVIEGDLVASAERVTIVGTVKGSLYVLARDLEISGVIEGSVHGIVEDTLVGGSVKGNLYEAGESITIAPTGVVAGDVAMFAETGVVAGRAGRDLVRRRSARAAREGRSQRGRALCRERLPARRRTHRRRRRGDRRGRVRPPTGARCPDRRRAHDASARRGCRRLPRRLPQSRRLPRPRADLRGGFPVRPAAPRAVPGDLPQRDHDVERLLLVARLRVPDGRRDAHRDRAARADGGRNPRGRAHAVRLRGGGLHGRDRGRLLDRQPGPAAERRLDLRLRPHAARRARNPDDRHPHPVRGSAGRDRRGADRRGAALPESAAAGTAAGRRVLIPSGGGRRCVADPGRDHRPARYGPSPWRRVRAWRPLRPASTRSPRRRSWRRARSCMRPRSTPRSCSTTGTRSSTTRTIAGASSRWRTSTARSSVRASSDPPPTCRSGSAISWPAARRAPIAAETSRSTPRRRSSSTRSRWRSCVARGPWRRPMHRAPARRRGRRSPPRSGSPLTRSRSRRSRTWSSAWRASRPSSTWPRSRSGCSRRGAAAARATLRALAVACGLLALGSKEIAIALPIALWLVHAAFVADWDRDWLRRTLPAVGGVAALGLGGLVWIAARPDPAWDLHDFGPGERVLGQARVLVFYLSLLALPLPSRLNLLHELAPSRSLLDPVSTLACWLVVAALLVLAISVRRRRRWVAFGLLWLLLHLALESGPLPLRMAFEHRLYLPLAGVCIAAAAILFSVCGSRRALAIGIAAVATVLLGAATHARNAVWSDVDALWVDTVEKSPGEWLAQMQWASVLARANRFDEAHAALDEASRLAPESPRPHNLRGAILRAQGRHDEALVAHRSAALLDPSDPNAFREGAIAAAEIGRLDEAAALLSAAYERSQDEQILHELGRVRETQGRRDEALALYRRAAAGNPAYAEPRVAAAQLLARAGRAEDAAALLEDAIRAARAAGNAGLAVRIESVRAELEAAAPAP